MASLVSKAISEVLGALRQLSRAVSLQTLRILDAGKTGFPERLHLAQLNSIQLN